MTRDFEKPQDGFKKEKPEDYLPDDALNSQTNQPEDINAEDKWNSEICNICGWNIHSDHHLKSKHDLEPRKYSEDHNENQSS